MPLLIHLILVFDKSKRLYRIFAAQTYSFLVINTTVPSDNALGFWKNLLEGVYRD